MFVFRYLMMMALVAPWVVAKPLPDAVVRRVAAQIDQQLVVDVQRVDKVPEALLEDGAFVRRAYLGIVGRIPSVEEVKAFIDDGAVSKRARLIDQLVNSPGFDAHLFNWAGDLLRVQTRGDQYGLGWHVWLRESLAEDKPWSQLVAEMLKASGHSTTDPAVGYYLRDRNMQLDNFSNTMQVFLGRQIGCAQCHDHPFEDWSQYEYYQMAAFSGGIEYRSGEVREVVRKASADLYQAKRGAEAEVPRQEKREFTRKIGRELQPFLGRLGRNGISDNEAVQLRLPKDYKYKDAKPGQVVSPATLFGTKLTDVPAGQRKQVFAEWLTSPDNPYFTTTIVNRMWERVFGYPLLDSLDNLGDRSKTAHPEVLAQLEHAMKQCNYDLRQFCRVLFRTQLFQRACMQDEPVRGEALMFSGMVLRRMTAEQLYDSFLVLRHGEVEDDAADHLEASWNGYVHQVQSVFNADAHDLMKLAESAKQGQQQLVSARLAFEKARKQLTAAESHRERVDAQVTFQQAREAMNEARQQANPLMMSMQMGSRRDRGADGRRASDLPAPFQLGTMVREFGGSDRESPSSGHTEASVPQALVLLNNWQTDVLAGKQNRLQDQLRELDSPEARLDWLFLTIFGELPNRIEKQRYLPLAKDTRALRDLATAMVNSKRFLFIQ